MYGWIWRHLPGPGWLKFFEVLILLAIVVYVLFVFVFPVINDYYRPVDTTISPAESTE